MDNNLHYDNQAQLTLTPEAPAALPVPAQRANSKAKQAATWLRGRLNEQNLWLVLTLLVAGVAHCWNMFAYPYLENDEGLYSAQAFSVFNQGKLTPYTYWYDHPPLGWMQIGTWLKLTGLMTFGNAVNSGRIFIAIVYIITCYFMFKLVAHLSANWLKSNTMRYVTGFAAVCITSLSPLSIFFQRQLLLDNIMIAWVMVATYILMVRYPKEHNLLELYGSAVALGVGIMSKEIGIVYVPVLLVAAWAVADRHHRAFAVVGWAAIVGAFCSTWFLYAFIKGELFPTGTLLGGDVRHVSLIETLGFQAGRGTGLAFWMPGSDFRSNWETNWANLDSLTPIIGLMAVISCLLIGTFFKGKRVLLLPALMALVYTAFLIRGGIVLYYYILPVMPWIGVSIALVGSILLAPLANLKQPKVRRVGVGGLSLASIALVGLLGFNQAQTYYGQRLIGGNQTYGQALARDYVLANVPNDATIVADDFFYLDLREPKNPAQAKSNVQIYFKVDTDPEIGQQMLKGDWRNIDYLLVTLQQMQKDLQARNLPMLNAAYQHSHLVKSFPSREGWELQLLKVDPLEVKTETVSFPNSEVVKVGQTFEISFDLAGIKADAPKNLNLLMEIRDKDRNKVGQDVVKVDEIPNGQSKNITFKWTVPAGTNPGEYSINIGAFDSNWTDNYMWQILTQPVVVSK